jgi:hypothetical protein
VAARLQDIAIARRYPNATVQEQCALRASLQTRSGGFQPPLKDLDIAENVAAESHHYQISRGSCF